MGLAVKPIECPGGCLGCYEKGIRESEGAPAFDLEKVLAALEKQMALDPENKWNSPTLHGGEPLALPVEAVDAVLKMIFDKYGRSGIQTSGALVRPEHIEIFKRYKTCVGISIDGDTAATNAGRWNAPGFNAAEMTDRTLYGMRLIKDAGVSLSVIALLRRYNAGTPALRSDLIRFGMRMKTEFGVESMRFNPLIAFDVRTEKEEALSNTALADTFRLLAIKAFAENLQWRPMLDFAAALRSEPVECAFGECDPWATEAEIPILGDGSLGTCMKVGGGPDGAATLRVPEKSFARYQALAQVRQDAGGCKGCFWWPYCKGGCPGAGIDGDWRNRTRFCEAYKETFVFVSSLSLFEAKAGCKPGAGGHGDREHGDSNDLEWRRKNPWWKGAVKK